LQTSPFIIARSHEDHTTDGHDSEIECSVLGVRIDSHLFSIRTSANEIEGSGFRLAEEASDSKGIERDVDIQNKLLSILYVKRRQNIKEPGIGNLELERLLDCPAEHLEFHIWYLKEKGWIGRTEKGLLAITVEGVDRANSEHNHRAINKLLTDQNPTD
jgi:hypothetical protein